MGDGKRTNDFAQVTYRGSDKASRGASTPPSFMQTGPVRVAFLSVAQLACKQQSAARGELLRLRGRRGEVASETAIIILFTGKRVSEWPNLLAVPDLYEIYEA